MPRLAEIHEARAGTVRAGRFDVLRHLVARPSRVRAELAFSTHRSGGQHVVGTAGAPFDEHQGRVIAQLSLLMLEERTDDPAHRFRCWQSGGEGADEQVDQSGDSEEVALG